MAADIVALLQAVHANSGLRRERLFLPRSQHLDTFDDQRLIRKYRFPRPTIMQIVEMCSPFLDRLTNRSYSISTDVQVLLALRFFAKGIFQDDCAELVGLSQASACRIIHKVASILVDKAHNFIKFPTEVDQQQIKSAFFGIAGFPNVIGLIDGTHVKIRRPGGLVEPLYVCRKGGHSINIQVICDHNMKFIDVVAKWPGATNDSYIWRNCSLREQFKSAPPQGSLIGDSGNGVEPWLLTPLHDPTSEKEVNYNEALTKTRRIVENSIGLWKSVFRRFDLSGGILLYTPEKICRFIVAGCVLHNLRRDLRLPVDEEYVHPPVEDDERIPNMEDDAISVAGFTQRAEFINNYF